MEKAITQGRCALFFFSEKQYCLSLETANLTAVIALLKHWKFMSPLGPSAHLISFACINPEMFSSIKINGTEMMRKEARNSQTQFLSKAVWLSIFVFWGDQKVISKAYLEPKFCWGRELHTSQMVKYLGSSQILLFVKLPQVQKKKYVSLMVNL